MKTNEPRKIDAAKVRARRVQLGLSHQELGKKIGVGPNAVSQWEHGINAPRPASYQLIAMALECRLEDLLEDPPVEEAKSKPATAKFTIELESFEEFVFLSNVLEDLREYFYDGRPAILEGA